MLLVPACYSHSFSCPWEGLVLVGMERIRALLLQHTATDGTVHLRQCMECVHKHHMWPPFAHRFNE